MIRLGQIGLNYGLKVQIPAFSNDSRFELIGVCSSNIDNAKKLKTRNTSIYISGAGSAIVYAKKILNIEVSGAGSVKYKGNPKVKKNINGAGSVTEI